MGLLGLATHSLLTLILNADNVLALKYHNTKPISNMHKKEYLGILTVYKTLCIQSVIGIINDGFYALIYQCIE